MKNISVVVPIYYGEKYIPDMIHQIEKCKGYLLDEDYIEVIFVNDAPNAPLSSSWKSDLVRVIIINTDKNVGIHGARVRGLKECQGDYILFLDQDDLVKSSYFYNQFSVLEENDATVCKAIHDGKNAYPDDDVFQKIVSKEYMLGKWNHIISPGQVLLRRTSIPAIWTEIILKHNGADDWFLWLCMLSAGCTFALNPEILYEHVVHGKNASDNILSMIQSQQEVISIIQNQRVFEGADFILLLEAFFTRYTNCIWELDILRKKFNFLNLWMKQKANGVRLAEYLVQSGVKTCGIYGCGILGEQLYEELKKTIYVKFFIDRNACGMNKNIPVYTIEDSLPETDIILISLFFEADKAAERIKEKSGVKTLKLTDWVNQSSLNEKLFLFGAGKIAERYTKILRQQTVEIYGYIDNDSEKWGTYFFDRKIYNPNILNEDENAVVVIACADIETITDQLTRMGMLDKVITIDSVIRRQM